MTGRKSGDRSEVSVLEAAERSELAQRLHAAVMQAGGPSQVSAESGVPLRTLNHYFTGREPKAAVLEKIAATCGVRTQWLLTGEEPRGIEEAAVAARLIEIVERLTGAEASAKRGTLQEEQDVAVLKIELEDIAENLNLAESYRMFANRVLGWLGDDTAFDRVHHFERGFLSGVRLQEPKPGIDADLLAEVLAGVDAVLVGNGQVVAVQAKAAVVSSAYEMALDAEARKTILQPRSIEHLLKLALSRV